MGTWGSGILQDDFADEVASFYVERLYAGSDALKASQETIQEFGELDRDEHSVFWLALAAIQMDYGRLADGVRSEALELIASGEDLEKWAGDARRARSLAAFARKLKGPQRPPKSLPKRAPKLQEGDIFRLRLDAERYAFGRRLTQLERAFYRFTSPSKRPPPNEIVESEVLFVVGSTDNGFASREWHVIGNLPLEERLRRPTHFYHRAVGEDVCTVFDVWHRDAVTRKHVSECKDLEQWGAWSAHHIRDRIEAALTGKECIWLRET
ncbi:MAG: immunity 26/phosphotriesterase HocA family protein [Deltaproteobacteria bacterium]|nr:immunity 26/phosphotriesterase HocA family protein [Deltaproteobacteria bacterium]